MLTYGSVCSGIEGASVAWAPLGWRCAFMAEVEAFPRAVLKHHYPEVPLYGDFTQLRDHHPDHLAEADVLVGGTPCQGFSVAGLRGSLSDDRSNLCLEFIRLANAIDDLRRAAGRAPAWILWENVPGVFSTEDNAFGAFLGGLVGSERAVDAGPRGRWTDAGVVAGPQRMAAWRVLDAQHFGLAQRRRRVFVLAVGGAGAWRCADALLPLADSLQGHPAPRRQTREGAAARALCSSDGGIDREDRHTLLSSGLEGGEITRALNACHTASGRHDISVDTFVAHSLRADGFDASEDGTGRGTPLVAAPELAAPLVARSSRGGGQTNSPGYNADQQIIAFTAKDAGGDSGEDIAPTLRAGEFAGSHANGGVGPAIAFNWQNGGGYGDANDGLAITEDGCGPLDASTIKAVAIPIAADALRGEGAALTPSPDAEGRIRLRDPGLGIGEDGDPAGTLQAAAPGAVFTLASRGRPGGHQLEFRDDELANAVLTPSGGRAGIGVGAVAFAAGAHKGWEPPLSASEEVSFTLDTTRMPAVAQTFLAFDAVQLTHPENRSNPQPGEPAPTLASGSDPMIAFNITPSQGNVDYNARPSDRAQALTGNGNRVTARGGDLIASSAVRRLTPTECERLQGFPDGYTDVLFRSKPAADGPRYKALGNSFATPVVRWIGERIAAFG